MMLNKLEIIGKLNIYSFLLDLSFTASIILENL